MKLEVEAAVELIKRFVSRNDSLSKVQTETFCDHTRQLLMQKFEGHWYDVDPVKGNGFRCLRINNQDPIEPTLLNACQLSGLQYKDLRLPRELTLWVDPGEVSCRIGEMRPQNFMVAKVSKDGLQYVEDRTQDIDIDDAERRHVESVRRTRSDLFSTTTTSSSAGTDARAKAAAKDLADRRALVANSSASSTSAAAASAFGGGYNMAMDNAISGSGAGGTEDGLIMPFFNSGSINSAALDNLDRFYGPLSSPPAKQLPNNNNLPPFNNGFLPSWNGAELNQWNSFYPDTQHGYPTKPVNSVSAVPNSNNNTMRGRANSYLIGGGAGSGGGLRQHNSLSSSSPISNSNSNLSSSSNTTPPPNSQTAINSRFSPPAGVGQYPHQQTHNAEQQHKRQPNSSGGMASHSSYANMTPSSVSTPVSAAGHHFVANHHQQHYNYQRQQQHQGPFNNPSAAAAAALAFFPPSMASGPGIPPHQHLMLSPAHGPNHHNANSNGNIMPNHLSHHHHNHPYGLVSHHSLIAQRSTALLSSE